MSSWRGGFDRMVKDRAEMIAVVDTIPAHALAWAYNGILLHNTGAPNMAQEDHGKDYDHDGDNEDDRLESFENYYKNLKHFPGGPHAFVYNSGQYGLGTPFTLKGTHSPGFNNTALGIEMVADFRPGVDDDEIGGGFVVKDNACFLLALLLEKMGKPCIMYPKKGATLRLHKDDPRTGHDCPGSRIDRQDIEDRVKAYLDSFSEAGDADNVIYLPVPVVAVPVSPPLTSPAFSLEKNITPRRVGWVNQAGLNLRMVSGMLGKVKAVLPKNAELKIIGEAKNLDAVWLHVVAKDSGLYGWVRSTYVSDNKILASNIRTNPEWAMEILTGLGWPKHQAAGAIGNFQRESFPDLRPDARGDYFLNGHPSTRATPKAEPTAFGVSQVRNERKDGLDAFAAARGKTWDDFETQILYADHELRNAEKASGDMLFKATTVEEATAAMASFERPRGWRWPKTRPYGWQDFLAAAHKVDGWDVRLGFAQTALRNATMAKAA